MQTGVQVVLREEFALPLRELAGGNTMKQQAAGEAVFKGHEIAGNAGQRQPVSVTEEGLTKAGEKVVVSAMVMVTLPQLETINIALPGQSGSGVQQRTTHVIQPALAKEVVTSHEKKLNK